MDSFTAITLAFLNHPEAELENQLPNDEEKSSGSGGVCVISHNDADHQFLNDEEKSSGSGGVCVIA